jgi:hypothetical protein
VRENPKAEGPKAERRQKGENPNKPVYDRREDGEERRSWWRKGGEQDCWRLKIDN